MLVDVRVDTANWVVSSSVSTAQSACDAACFTPARFSGTCVHRLPSQIEELDLKLSLGEGHWSTE